MTTFQQQLRVALKSAPIIFIPHFDNKMVDETILDTLGSMGLNQDVIYENSAHAGIIDFKTKKRHIDQDVAKHADIVVWLEDIINAKIFDNERIFLYKNIHIDAFSDARIQSLLHTFASKYQRGDYKDKGDVYSILFVSPMPVARIPSEIEKIITIVEPSSPNMNEIRQLIDTLPLAESARRRLIGEQEDTFREEITYTLLGLHAYEINQILRSIFARSGKYALDFNSAKWALEEKQRIVKKTGIIELIDSDIALSDVGGLEVLKMDIERKAIIYKHLNNVLSKNIKLPLPKGALILGMPGCGKSMIAKAIANAFGVSLLRLDVNRLMGQYVGMSEENLRRALQTAETAHPCVLWIDEVEKAFAGAGAGNDGNDMLVQRLMGQFLTWMQERKTAVYIVATANYVMRPEFMRKGRFDDVYFVDFPNKEERKSILINKMRRYGFLNHNSQTIYDFSEFDTNNQANDKVNQLAALMLANDKKEEMTKDKFSNGFSGAEIESVVNQVMEEIYIEYQKAIDAKRPIKTPIKVTFERFESAIKTMRPTVMANQISKEDCFSFSQQTSIERIRALQKIYKFKKASI